MARIAHLSDIHFGAHNPSIVAATESWLAERQPDLVIISGDLTQRAKADQFREASTYLERLREHGFPVLVVPAITTSRYIMCSGASRPHWLGTNDSSLTTYAHGSKTTKWPCLASIRHDRSPSRTGASTVNRSRCCRSGLHRLRRPRLVSWLLTIRFMPCRLGEGGELSEAVGRHRDAVEAICEAGVHLALAGHFHRTYAEAAHKMVEKAGSVLVMQAGTATSTRLRNDELQSFNWIHAYRYDEVELQVIAWDGSAFRRGSHERFTHDGANWSSQTVNDSVDVIDE